MPLLWSSKPAGASEGGGGSEAKARATPTITAAMKLLMVFPCPSERTVREPRLGHGRHIGGGQGPEVGDAPFKVVQFPRQAFVPGARGFGRTAARVPVPRWPRLYIRFPRARGVPGELQPRRGDPVARGGRRDGRCGA